MIQTTTIYTVSNGAGSDLPSNGQTVFLSFGYEGDKGAQGATGTTISGNNNEMVTVNSSGTGLDAESRFIIC